MIYQLLRKTLKPIIFIALISLVTTWAFGIQNNMITTQSINGIQIKTFNFYLYMQTISNAWMTNALKFEDILPTRVWDETGFDFWNQNQFWGAVINNIAFVFDWLYFPINFILWLLRWLCWLIKLLLAIIGWNTLTDEYGNYYSQLASILAWITQNLMIPYV